MIYVGTSGWQYKSWKGPFYPAALPQTAWLRHYATRFPVVEVNNSFYMLPKESSFDRWRTESPPGFVVVVKANRYVTHIRRLRDPKDAVGLFWSRATRLREKLGPVLFQLPPNFRVDVALLRDFLSVLPAGMKAAFEFREGSWWRDDVYEALDAARAAWVLADRPGWRVPLVVTGGWSYLRFHQGRPDHPAYTSEKLSKWADRIAGLPVEDSYVFFNNDPLAAAPSDAARLVKLLTSRGAEVARAEGEPAA